MAEKESITRLHVLIRPESNYAVVIRRGPSKQVCTVGWKLNSDEFKMGQWMKGRIYERRSDISPDGRHMIYFAMNGKWDSESTGAWTAVSKVPYLRAIAMWTKGDCWHGGGLFEGNRKYCLNDGWGHKSFIHSKSLHCNKQFHSKYGGECPGVYYIKLQRDGWELTNLGKRNQSGDVYFEKPLSSRWVLRKVAHATIDSPVGKGCYYDEHEFVNTSSGKAIEHHDWEWCEFHSNRLLWATEGKIYSGQFINGKINDIKELHDFNNMEFEAIEAPY